MQDSIFREKSLKKITSPEELHDYIRISNPAIWVILAGIIVLLIAIFIWSVTGRLETKYSVSGIVQEDAIVCYCADTSDLEVGQETVIGSVGGKVSFISEEPTARGEIAEKYGADSYAMYCLDPGEWSFVVEIEADTVSFKQGEVVTVSVITDSVSPISFVLGGR
ncbi:MAG: hypothetical protein HUJ65_00570 [Oscillospiraceae bacterium]|nr:hypothetical protein [Oscillospiraceae bacterium]